IAFTILWFWISIPVVIVSSFLICRVLLWCITRCILCRFLPGLLIFSGGRICFSFRSVSVIIFLTRRCTCFCSICIRCIVLCFCYRLFPFFLLFLFENVIKPVKAILTYNIGIIRYCYFHFFFEFLQVKWFFILFIQIYDFGYSLRRKRY